MFLTDKDIQQIRPIYPCLQKLNSAGISYGLSSCGYDIRLSSHDVRIFQHVPGAVADVKQFDERFLVNPDIIDDSYFILPGNSYALGVSIERFDMPDDLFGICIGKSTYARAGIICNLTPIEPGWCGYLTIEISNSSSSDCKIYVNEGIAQILFYKLNERPLTTYSDRSGKYQGQLHQVTMPTI